MQTRGEMIMKRNWLFKLLRNKDFIQFIAALIMLVIAFVIHRWLTFDISLRLLFCIYVQRFLGLFTIKRQAIMNHFNATKVYELPDEIAKRSDWLLKAHVDALKYNSRTVRLDDLKKCGNQVMLTYSNVTYWDLLMTNHMGFNGFIDIYLLEKELWEPAYRLS